MREIKETHTAKFELNIRRNHIVEDSFIQIRKIKSEETRKLRKNLWINYIDEKGDDFGGVARDWFHNLSTELFNPYYGLFEYSANDVYTLQINPDSGNNITRQSILSFVYLNKYELWRELRES